MNRRRVLLKRGFLRFLSLTATFLLVVSSLVLAVPASTHVEVSGANIPFSNSLAGESETLPLTAVSGVIESDTVWEGEILVENTVVVAANATLTVLPGTLVKFNHYRGYREPEKRLRLLVLGTLIAEGTAEQPIYFTSDAPEPQNGDWSMIRLYDSEDSAVHYCVVEFGQQGINVWGGAPNISHCAIRWHNWEGVYFESYSNATLEYCQIYENGYNGLAAEQYNTITMDHCDVWRNGTNGVHVDATTLEIRCSRVHENQANGLSVDDNAALSALGVAIYDNNGCGIGYGEGNNTVEVSHLEFYGNSANICGSYTEVASEYYPPEEVNIGFEPDQSYVLGYIPSDPVLDRYMYVYPDDETRQIVRKIGDGLGLTWSLAWDGQHIWTATLWGTIYKLDPLTGEVIAQFTAPGPQPWGMTFDGENLWMVDFAEKRISRLNPDTLEELDSYPTPDPAAGCKGVTWDGTYLCVMGWASSVIYKMDREGQLIDTITLEKGGGGIAWDGQHFWVPCGGKILKYDQLGHQVGWVYAASEGTWDMTWDGTYLWASQRTNENWSDAKIFALKILDDHSTEPQTLYVDGANPGTGDGSPLNPYGTIIEAMRAAYPGDEIEVAQGTYTENLVLNEDIDLYGGYASYLSENAWTRDITQYETIIDGNQDGSVITFQADSEGAVLDGFTITSGNTSEGGGGITVTGVSPVIRSCIIRENFTSGEYEWGGGGILIAEGASPTISNTVIIDNLADGGAGGVRVGNASVTMVNCLVTGNLGRPAIHTNNASLTLTNVTIADHGAEGGILLNHSQAAIVNTIIWENTGPDINAINGSDYTIEYSDVEDGVLTGMGNISYDPVFTGGGDYHLQSGSPAIDTGNTEAAPVEDLEGNPRPIDGDGDGTAIADMGAYEHVYQEPPPVVYFTDASEPLGNIYKLEDGTETIYHTRGNGCIYNLAFSPDGSLYYSDINDNDLYKLENGSEALVYHHSTYLRDVAFDSEERLYFSEASGSADDGHIYRLNEDRTVSEYYTVSLADVTVWGGDFTFDESDNLYLSTGKVEGARIYRVTDGIPQEIFSASEDEAVAGICCDSARSLYYASWLGGEIYKVNADTGERSLFYSNPEHSLLSDVFIPARPLVTLPDLVITDVWSEDRLIYYQIRNIGKAVAPGGHDTALFIGGEPVTTDTVDTDIAPGERLNKFFDFEWVCTEEVMISVAADVENIVIEYDDANNIREETWRCDITPPGITSGPTVSDTTTSSAVITWITDESSNSTVIYGTTRSLLDARQETDTTQTIEHSITLQSLQPSTTYCFKVRSSDPAGNSVSSQPMTFETHALPDETDPTISLVDPGQCTGDVLISTSASDDTGVQMVEFYLNDTLVFTDYSEPYQLPLNTTLYENGIYNLISKVFDLAGRSSNDQQEINISNIKDMTYPTVTITSHQDDDIVSGKIKIISNISDDTGIDSVRFYVDGDYTEYSPCYPPVPTVILGQTFEWNTKWVSDGLHSVAVEAMDIDGKLGVQNVRLNVDNAPAPPPPTPYLNVVGNSVSRTQNRFTITLKVKNEGDGDATNVKIKYGLRGFQSIDSTSTQVDYTAEYYAAGKFDICNITPKQNIPAGATRTYTFNAIPVLLYPNPPAPEPGFFIDMSWQSSGGSKYFDYVELPATKTTGGETIKQAYNNALKFSDYLIVTNPGLVYAKNKKTDTSSLFSTMARLAWDEQGVLGYFYSGSAGALNNLTKAGGSWSSKLKSGWTSSGYLLIVGETDIMPAWSYVDGSVEISTGEDYELKTSFTDLPYANTAGSILTPELSLGRIIGNSASELEKVIQTSITVYEGGGIGMFDRSDFFSVSGYSKCLSGGCGNIDFKKEALADALTMKNKGIDGIAMFTPDYSQYDATGQINSLLTKNLIRQKFFGNTPNKDVIFLAGHGNAGSWDVISSNDILNPGIVMPFGVTSPFVFASSCLTGRYYGGTCPGEAFLQRGAGAYLGAVEPGLVPPHDSISKRFFEKWDAGESIGLAVKQTKQSNSGQCEDYWSVIYNLYGDPKFGSQGPPGDVSNSLGFQVESEPPSSIDVVIPDYEVSQSQGYDYVEIPGGGILSMPGKPLIPYYRVFYDYPQGYKIQDVALTSISEPITTTGLNIPNSLIELPGWEFSDQSQQSRSLEWLPEKSFEWAVQENPDGITLAITIYPFFYNPLTTDVRFYSNYSFSIAYTVSNIKITKLEIDKPSYSINEGTGYIEFSDGEEGEIPPEGTDTIVDIAFRVQGSDEVFSGLRVRTLRNFRGRASYSFEWDAVEGMPPVYDVEVVLRDAAGNLLDKKIEILEQGVPSLDITDFSVSPQQCQIGDNIDVNIQLENTGTYYTLSGTAIIQVRNEAGDNITEFNHQFTDLVPGGNLNFNSTWDTSDAAEGAYHILGYVSYGNTSSSPIITEVTIGMSAQPGDANGDGVVDVLDITKVARIILELDDPTPGADANEDDLINVFDMTKIARIILELD